jgi:biopolymer transport protein ExbD
MSRRKKKGPAGKVELNLAAMLDMAFQLLTFFILTFKPAPVEGQLNLALPTAQAASNLKGQAAGQDTTNTDTTKGLETLLISVFSTPDGRIANLAIGEGVVPGVDALEFRMKAVFADPKVPFEQVILQVGGDLRYDELMRVMDICTRQTLPDGKKLTKVSFVELPGRAR